jgi:lycopene beta-cyclase
VQHPAVIQNGNRVLEIGQLAGVTKPTTGYTFNRIHRVNEQIARALSDGKVPVVYNQSAARFRFYDLLLLDILVNDAEFSEQIFTSLFRSNKMDRILKFLDEKTEVPDDVRILATLPFRPFLKALGKNKSQILRRDF